MKSLLHNPCSSSAGRKDREKEKAFGHSIIFCKLQSYFSEKPTTALLFKPKHIEIFRSPALKRLKQPGAKLYWLIPSSLPNMHWGSQVVMNFSLAAP